MTKDWKIFILLYLITLGILLTYNLTHEPINDRVKEYETYQLNIDHGWEHRRTLINSALVTTWVPAEIQQHSGVDEMTLFKVWPCLFYALLPAFTYLIARRILSVELALVASAFVIANSYILFFPDVGRVGVAIAFMAGMIWALLGGRWWWALAFGLLVVFSHYGTCIVAAGLVAACLVLYWLWKKQWLRQYALILGAMLLAIGVWHFWIAGYSGWVMTEYATQQNIPSMTGDIVGPQYGLTEGWTSLDAREPAVQRAFGSGEWTIPGAIETLANWLVVGMITLGAWLLVRNRKAEDMLRIMVAVLWLLVVATVLVPWMSTNYGGMRVLFTGLCVLAIGIPVAAKWVVGVWRRVCRSRLYPAVVYAPVLLLFALSTSGLVYSALGDAKVNPVYFVLQ